MTFSNDEKEMVKLYEKLSEDRRKLMSSFEVEDAKFLHRWQTIETVMNDIRADLRKNKILVTRQLGAIRLRAGFDFRYAKPIADFPSCRNQLRNRDGELTPLFYEMRKVFILDEDFSAILKDGKVQDTFTYAEALEIVSLLPRVCLPDAVVMFGQLRLLSRGDLRAYKEDEYWLSGEARESSLNALYCRFDTRGRSYELCGPFEKRYYRPSRIRLFVSSVIDSGETTLPL